MPCVLRRGRAELEGRHQLHQFVGTRLEVVGGAGALLDQGRVLLRDLIHLRDGFAGLLHPVALLGGRVADFFHQLGHALDGSHHVLGGLAGARGQFRALLDTLAVGGDQGVDLLGRRRGTAGQLAHFLGDHGETSAMLTGARRLDGGVERQDVGLEGNAVDHGDDIGHFIGAGIDVAHGLHHLGDDLATFFGDTRGIGGLLARLGGIVGVVLDGAAQLFHGGGGLGQRAGLLLGTGGQLIVSLGDLLAVGGHRFGRTAHFPDRLLQSLRHRHLGGHDAVAILRFQRHLTGQVAIAHRLGEGLDLVGLRTELAQQQSGQQRGHQPPDHQGPQAQQDHGDLEVLGDIARKAGFGGIELFLQGDEGVDVVEPGAEGRRRFVEQQLLGPRNVACLTPLEHFLDQRHGRGLNLLDSGQGVTLFGSDIALREDLPHTGRSLAVVAFEAPNVRQDRRQVGLVVDQDRIAHGDGAIVHAASEIDRILLLDAVDVIDDLHAVVDQVDLAHTLGGQDDHQQEHAGKAGRHPGPNRRSP